jgi:hypothetical protein
MSKNFRQGKYKGPIVKIKDRKFEFDEEKAFVKEQHMLQKKSDITSPGTNPIKREIFEENYFDKKRKTTVENKYLKSSLETNPYYMQEGELSGRQPSRQIQVRRLGKIQLQRFKTVHKDA